MSETKNGYLDVGNGHRLYWEDWGNPNGKPILHLHGGPGAGFSEKHKLLYDPEFHRVIFHDQRGCGKSLPFAETSHNTTQYLIEDVDRLRRHLGVERIQLSGGSWGSALALLYAIAHPGHVERMMLWSVFLARRSDLDFVNEGYARHCFPLEWRRFLSHVPEGSRESGESIMRYYSQQMRSANKEVARRYACEWALWEAVLMSIKYEAASLEQEVFSDENTLTTALLETHYFENGCFVPENFILENVAAIRDVPCRLIHGRFDMCTPASGAVELAEEYGAGLRLRFVNAGHRRTDPEMLEALRETAREFLV